MVNYNSKTAALICSAALQFRLSPVHGARKRIQDDTLYTRKERNRISAGSVYQRPSRGIPPPVLQPTNDPTSLPTKTPTPMPTDVPTLSPTSQRPNLVLVPNCDPNNSLSFYNNANSRQDTTSDCDRYRDYCGKKHSDLTFNSWPNYVFPSDFYDTVELMYERCFDSCATILDGGTEEFCSMPDPPPQAPVESSYCFSVESDGENWTSEMVAEEANILAALNKQRDDPAGATCQRMALDANSGEVRITEGFFPRSSPVVPNEALRCAARIQAKNIVDETIERGTFPSNLHNACPSRGDAICEKFTDRMDNAGYEYFSNGFGYTNEVTAAGYRSAEAVVAGWKGSKSGHCEAILKQESKIVPTEVGIGYYRDPSSGMTGHVIILAQRNL